MHMPVAKWGVLTLPLSRSADRGASVTPRAQVG